MKPLDLEVFPCRSDNFGVLVHCPESGVTASILLFAMNLLGKEDTALYDGSWTEWGADPETPKATAA